MTRDKRSAERGQSMPTSDDELLTALHDLGGVAGTYEIAEAVDAPYRSTRECLTRLFETGEVNRRSIGVSFLWLLGSTHDNTGDP